MRKLTNLLVGVFCLPLLMMGQQEALKSTIVSIEYIKVKPGMEAKFEAAVKSHNNTFHKDGAYVSSLFYITVGDEAGWYVWTMGPFSYTQLDGAPGEGAHADDWRKKIATYVAEYGRSEFWRHNNELSVNDGDNESMQTTWVVDVKRGEWYRFEAFMEKVAAIHKKKNEEFHMWTNEYHSNDGRDVALTWPFDKWAEMDENDWKMKEEYDAEYGEGSWDNALEEWEDIVVDITQKVWRRVE
ncbi:hypothetical protein Oweho_1035 [Owenweeksia hongkongensis DSM 17368]|uniref:Uncharacterized protein n=1 Tax=Owenweeksia hongkongensis (strain DSM 17368 / CIP 108786 / JCM 12287 / NRRL B-23963 / UST20020801) TaxID=926562 RepID=G8R412_OWEHD|nr:hypothetical protein [Owenweeksia hongkongensis]AEV32044.1 hypothetical protein Oweho_1035 [Owenweeksia hongkongensis DSM 17368]